MQKPPKPYGKCLRRDEGAWQFHWYPRLPGKLNPRSLNAMLGAATGAQ